MNTLHTPCCILEPQVEAHAPEMFPVLSDPAIYEFEGVPPPSVEALAAGFRRKQARVSPDGRDQWLNWVVRRTPGGALAGYVQATVLPSGASLIGYELASPHWRQGIGSAAVRAVLDELVAAYAVHTVVAVLKRANHRSEGLLRHLGFVPGSAEDALVYEAGPDEIVRVKVMGAVANSGD